MADKRSISTELDMNFSSENGNHRTDDNHPSVEAPEEFMFIRFGQTAENTGGTVEIEDFPEEVQGFLKILISAYEDFCREAMSMEQEKQDQ